MSLAPVDLANYISPPYVGFDLQAELFAASLNNVPAEGVWVPTAFVKTLSIEISGSMSTLAVDLIGSNRLSDPGNQTTITVGGTVTTSDVCAIAVQNAALPGGTVTASYTTVGGDTTATIATALAAAINANTALRAIGVNATAANSVVTISYPSAVPPASAETFSPSAPAIQNFSIFIGTVTGAGTESLTIANASVGTPIGSEISALGFTQLSVLPRWLKAQINTLTGSGAAVTGRIHGAA